MSFEDALKIIKSEFKSMRLPTWNEGTYIAVHSFDPFTTRFLAVVSKNGYAPWTPTQVEIMREDWEIVVN